jgi:hypothetical protein
MIEVSEFLSCHKVFQEIRNIDGSAIFKPIGRVVYNDGQFAFPEAKQDEKWKNLSQELPAAVKKNCVGPPVAVSSHSLDYDADLYALREQKPIPMGRIFSPNVEQLLRYATPTQCGRAMECKDVAFGEVFEEFIWQNIGYRTEYVSLASPKIIIYKGDDQFNIVSDAVATEQADMIETVVVNLPFSSEEGTLVLTTPSDKQTIATSVNEITLVSSFIDDTFAIGPGHSVILTCYVKLTDVAKHHQQETMNQIEKLLHSALDQPFGIFNFHKSNRHELCGVSAFVYNILKKMDNVTLEVLPILYRRYFHKGMKNQVYAFSKLDLFYAMQGKSRLNERQDIPFISLGECGTTLVDRMSIIHGCPPEKDEVLIHAAIIVSRRQRQVYAKNREELADVFISTWN